MGVYKKQRKDGSNAWYFKFMYNGRTYRQLGGTTRTQAQRALEKKRTEVIDQSFGITKQATNPKFEDFTKIYLERRKHMRSQRRDNLSARNLMSYFKSKELMSINSSHILDYISFRLKKGVTNATVNRELACLKRMYALAVKWGDANFNPAKDVELLEEPPGRTRYLTESEANELIQHADAHLKPILITALNTGMRLEELLSLHWKNVFIDSVITPYIEIQKTKNNKSRSIPLTDDMVNLLSFLKRQLDSEYVFVGTHGKRLKSVRKPFLKALKKIGIEDFRFHDLRHTFASHYIMNGGDLLSLKEILGHSSLKMVEKYSHLAAAYKHRQISNLNGKFSTGPLFGPRAKD